VESAVLRIRSLGPFTLAALMAADRHDGTSSPRAVVDLLLDKADAAATEGRAAEETARPAPAPRAQDARRPG
jgi:hypothetical protein